MIGIGHRMEAGIVVAVRPTSLDMIRVMAFCGHDAGQPYAVGELHIGNGLDSTSWGNGHYFGRIEDAVAAFMNVPREDPTVLSQAQGVASLIETLAPAPPPQTDVPEGLAERLQHEMNELGERQSGIDEAMVLRALVMQAIYLRDESPAVVGWYVQRDHDSEDSSVFYRYWGVFDHTESEPEDWGDDFDDGGWCAYLTEEHSAIWQPFAEAINEPFVDVDYAFSIDKILAMAKDLPHLPPSAKDLATQLAFKVAAWRETAEDLAVDKETYDDHEEATNDAMSEVYSECASQVMFLIAPHLGYDTASSASRQHFIDTGEYLRQGEAE